MKKVIFLVLFLGLVFVLAPNLVKADQLCIPGELGETIFAGYYADGVGPNCTQEVPINTYETEVCNSGGTGWNTMYSCVAAWTDWTPVDDQCGITYEQTRTYKIFPGAVEGDLKFPYEDGYKETREVTNPECPPQEFNLTATKIICPSEDLLPNWGAGGSNITNTTASDFLIDHPSCYQTEWNFEWSLDGVSNPGDQVSSGGSEWNVFSESTTIPLSEQIGQKIWVREQMSEEYIPFTGANTDQDVSAEFYCHTDVLHYDNWEWIYPIEANGQYNCVAFNVAKIVEPTDMCPNIEGVQETLPEGMEINDEGDCVYAVIPPVYQCSDDIDNDKDGKIDFPEDPGCTSATDDDEYNRGSSSGGGYVGGGSSGQVLGAETEALCTFGIDTYMRKGYKNNAEQVKILQWLLNKYADLATPLLTDGNFGTKTESAVKAFQVKYKDNILTPWNLTNPTGIFFRTTLVQAKNLECPQEIVPIPTNLINWSQSKDLIPTKA